MQAYDGPIYIADAALYLMAHKPELGIKDPYELNEDQYKAALDLLRQQRQIVQPLLARRHRAGRRLHQRGRGRLRLLAVPGQPAARARTQPIASIIPEEGATGWADTTMMHADAPHPNCAYMWLEHSLEPKLQGDLAAWFGSVPVGAGRLQGQRAARPTTGCETNGIDEFRQDRLLAHAGRQVRDARTRLRALLPLGDRLHRGARRPVTRDRALAPPARSGRS